MWLLCDYYVILLLRPTNTLIINNKRNQSKKLIFPPYTFFLPQHLVDENFDCTFAAISVTLCLCAF